MKQCCKCKISKPLTDFYANKRMKDGRNTFCIFCHKADNIARKAKNRANPEFKFEELSYKKEYRAKTVEQRKDYMKQWHSENKQQQSAYREQYYNNNPEYFKKYRIINKHKINAKTRKRQAAKIQRTPKWLTQNDLWMIEEAYELAALRTKLFGFPWEVDHVLPLQGKVVSGLHTPYNLQVIPAKQNRSKANRMEV
jgi:hypothetical protein